MFYLLCMNNQNNYVKVNLRISPNSKNNEIIKEANGIVKVKIMAQPIDGKANKALIEFLSKNFKIPKTSIKIVKGETTKEKTIVFQTEDKEKISLLNKTFN